MWLRVYYNKIPIYPIFYLLKGDYTPFLRLRAPGATYGKVLKASLVESLVRTPCFENSHILIDPKSEALKHKP